MSGKTISHPGGVWKLRVLLYLICFVLPVAWMLRTEDVFGMETEKDTETDCTIFIYMCGSNLESEYGLASENIDELLEADIPDQVNVIIETGGTSRWWSSEWIEEDKLQRYMIRNHQLELLMEMDNASMGSAPVLGDFLRWGAGELFFRPEHPCPVGSWRKFRGRRVL